MLDELGLPPCEDGTLLLRRTISAGGGGRVWVNDSASTVQTLKNLGRALVDVHGPNDSQRLVEEGFQRELVDAFAPAAAREAYAAAWRQYSALVEERDALNSDSAESVAEEIERLRYSVDEIEAAALSAEDDDDRPRRHAAAAITIVSTEFFIVSLFVAVSGGRCPINAGKRGNICPGPCVSSENA